MNKTPKNAVSSEAVTWAYRLILGREPESRAVIQDHIRGHTSLESLRQGFMSSKEFKHELEGFRGFYKLRDGIKQTTNLAQPEMLDVDVPGQIKKQIGSTFFRGQDCNYLPYAKDYANSDFIETFLLKGWMPGSKLIDSNTKVTTFGSCFAISIANHLSKIGYSILVTKTPISISQKWEKGWSIPMRYCSNLNGHWKIKPRRRICGTGSMPRSLDTARRLEVARARHSWIPTFLL